MYQVKCDGFILYDPRDEDLILLDPKCKLAVNTVGEGSFTILPNHPFYDKLQRLKSIIEISQDEQVIFRGRMTDDSSDFYNQLDVDLEGVLGFANDSIIPPFDFPAKFPEAESSTNVVEYFLQWILEQHNEQVEDWQMLKLGTVTVSDPNNYLARSSTDFASTWDTLKSKLFESALGGFLKIRYEADGNYVDYLAEFTENNVQQITFGENLLDLTSETDASQTYSAILPIGAETEDEAGNKSILTLADLPDGDLTDDLVKKGKFIYSKSAVEQCGWICAPVSETKWDDVTLVENLKTKAIEYLAGTAMMLSNTITIKAVDLNFTDDQIQSFRIYQNILVNSFAHGLNNAKYQLTQLDIDILNPQNTTITIGDTVRTLIDINSQKETNTVNKVESVVSGAAAVVEKNVMESVNQEWVGKEEALIQTCSDMIDDAKAEIQTELDAICTQKVLWTGGSHVLSDSEIFLSEPISGQKSGIVLEFSLFNGDVVDEGFNLVYVPKSFTSGYLVRELSCTLSGDGIFGKIACKKVIVSDNQIGGTDTNDDTGTSNGITYDNSAFILRNIYGV